jgi:hypothetical protein
MTTQLDEVFQGLFAELGNDIGFPLALVAGSLTREGELLFANGRSAPAAGAREVRLETLARILVAPGGEGEPAVSAIVFYYVNGARVAPAGACNMRFSLAKTSAGTRRWVTVGWEADELDEWSDLCVLQDE